MMDALTNWSDRTDKAIEQSIENAKPTTNSDQGAALPASPSSKIYSEEFFAVNFSITRRAIQGRNAYAAWARKLGSTKKDDPEFLRVHEENQELDQLVENYNNPTKSQEEAVPKVVSTPLRQDRPESAPQGKKSTKRTRDSEGFISPPKHLTRKAPKANPTVDITDDAPTSDLEVDVNILEPVVAASPPKPPKIPPFFVNPKGDWRTLITLAKLRAPSIQSKLTGRFFKVTVDTADEYIEIGMRD
ncbi:hypothetical protein NPIL_111831 [Nephila pilipes]|uniref:Uncharacterized protein n=1 Tax=Nephila pilipes TaxID=299642 RepID=A0A8X6UDF4_NEPPI|nr:hypothetical protein NPIL_111831 [Nephila pilipes]